MKGKSLGWLLLVGALAVPAVLFYKWWTQMKATQGVEAKQAVPAAAPFSAGGTSAPEPAPEPAPAPAENPPPQASPAPAPQPEPAPQAVVQAAPEPAPTAAPAPSPEPAAGEPEQAAEPQEPPPAANPSGMVAKIEYMPKTSRDPMLSVADQRQLLKERLAAQISQQEVQKAVEEVPVAPPPPPAKPFCDNFDLQGIIGAGGDVAAIVNDRIVREGDPIAGAVVERLTTRTVVFRKGKKTCMKRVSK